MTEYRVKFDFVVHFTNGGSLAAQDFRLDIPGSDIADDELAAYLIQDMRLLMAGQVDITNKQILEEPHKRAAISTAGLPMGVHMANKPGFYLNLTKKHPQYIAAVEALGQAVRESGPLDSKQLHLVQLAAAAAIRSEGAVHSHARRALGRRNHAG